MSNILIAYDLNKVGQNYTNLIEKIKTLGAWWHYLDSTWIVVTNQTAVQVRDALKPHIDSNDELLVLDITGDSAAWVGFDNAASKWLTDNL